MSSSVNLDVQAELQEYLAEKGINALFVKMVESLLLNKPSEPISFLVKYLKEHYPAECKDITMDNGPVASGGSAYVSNLAGGGKEAEDSDSEDDEDEEMAELPVMAKREVQPKGRRVSVSAESVDPDTMKDKFEKKIIPKTIEEQQQIKDMLQKQLLFGHLDVEQTQIIVDAMFKVTHKAGDNIIVQGAQGDNFYLIAEGTCECYINQPDGSELMVLKCGVGDSFGELALLYNAPRAATVRATSETKLWAVDRMTFKYILMTSTIAKRQQYAGFIKNVMILSCLQDKEQNTILDALVPVSFKAGQVIIKEGEPGDVFYIVEYGEVVCTQQHQSDQPSIEVCKLTKGAYFGEIALLTDRPRQATVTCVSEVRCLTLERKTFKRVMGPLVDLLKRNISLYNNYMAGKI
jgi:cAMP-dependent protein kinase regulator